MPRSLTAGTLGASLARIKRPVIFVECDFGSGMLRANSWNQDIAWNGFTWLGAGRYGKISPVEESAEFGPRGIVLELSGVPTALIATALAEHYQGRRARVWKGFLDEQYRLIDDPTGPVAGFIGRMDTMDITGDPLATIRLSIESRAQDWRRPRIRRYTDADQQARFPGDTFFANASLAAEKQVIWGRG